MTEPTPPPALVYAGDDHLLYLDDRRVHVRLPDHPLEHLPVGDNEAQALYRRHLDPLLARSVAQRANQLLATLDDAGTTSAARILSGCITNRAEEDLSARSGRQEVMTATESYLIDWDRRTISTGEATHELQAVHHLLPGQDGLVRIGGVEDTGLPAHRRLGLVLRIRDLPVDGD
ncbi:hypothetical protein [Corynebacterium halotolerans]|uniref:Uncharacterized protein n=1 Tax=Corynebacterium halotolerans YIM 70093 = DSM 44683 TaxID=1121362 RepID=M1N0A9_9CORY|nr:hypothetical protein [Corynebacterium halotolerans]AGF73399.1 hypothetical protein A605_12015 [Corynebacterium halotolerans YIM 70093 = DSM 44683]